MTPTPVAARLRPALVAVAIALGCVSAASGATLPATTPLNIPERRALSRDDVGRIVSQAAAEARARGAAATIAVTDRVGNVLAVFAMNGAPNTARAPDAPSGQNAGLQGALVPTTLAVIAKALTGAYLSSSGNAFSTRTASMIVQEHFPPGSIGTGLEGGPLFGVQFSQLPCSDLNARYAAGAAPGIGPKRSPLGFSADPGGLPLYKDGVVVGGIGVDTDGVYGLDRNVIDRDYSTDELVAVAGTSGFAAPTAIRANRITVDGTSLRYVDRDMESLATNPGTAPAFAAVDGVWGSLVRVTGYYAETGTPALLDGVAYGTEASGVRPARPSEYGSDSVYVLTDGSGTNRYPPRSGGDAGTVGQPLTVDETRRLLEEAFIVMIAARAQIRQPLNSRAQVSISVVDSNGMVLGIVRGPDAPVFGIDVSLQKARSAMFLSSPRAADSLSGARGSDAAEVAGYLPAARAFLRDPNALTGGVAFAARAIGNLSRPFFPDGQVGTANGPLSRPFGTWNIIATGLQDTLVRENILAHIGFVGGTSADTPQRCTYLPDAAGVVPAVNPLQNGLQIFPGGVPIYRGGQLIGGIGVSGDGIDQDDMIAFLGVHNAAQVLRTVNNAPAGMRSDQVVAGNAVQARLRYVNCPYSPFVGSREQRACSGK